MRKRLQELMAERRVSAAHLSKHLGRNSAYIQQFLQRHSPHRLPELERRKLAAFFGVDEQELGGPAPGEYVRGPLEDDLPPPEEVDETPRVSERHRVNIKAGFIPEFDLRAGASYGGGYALPAAIRDGETSYDADRVKAQWGIPASFLQGELRLHPHTTDVIAVDGPSMIPDLLPGDRVLIDRSHRDPRQGGIFAVREGDGIIIKHVEVVRGSDPPRIVCKSSNQTYAPFELVLDGETVAIIGRVAGRISRM